MWGGGKMIVFRITKKMVKEWLGTDNQLEEAIEVIQDLANGTYTIDGLNRDIIEYFDFAQKEKK
jgi:hypothetical protein